MPRRRHAVLRPALLVAVVACSSGELPSDPTTRSTTSPLGTPGVTWGVQGLSGHYTASDKFEHAIVFADGKLREIYFDSSRQFMDTMGHWDGVRNVASYVDDSEGTQHVLVASTDNRLHDVWWSPSAGMHDAVVASFPGTIVDVAGFYSQDDARQHAIVLFSDGSVSDVSWGNNHTGQLRQKIGQIPGAVSVAGFYAKDDHNRIVHVGGGDGTVYEIYYHSATSPSQDVIQSLGESIVAMASLYSDDDHYRHSFVATSTGNVYDVFYNPCCGIQKRLLTTVSGPARLGAFATPDNYRHVLVGLQSGEVRELFFNANNAVVPVSRATFGSDAPYLEDQSPEWADSVQTQRDSIAGYMVGLAGDGSTLYAVSPDAGLWKSVAGAPFAQLQGSPRYSMAVAVDPKNVSHVFVGERNGDARDVRFNTAGLWESTNGGASWTFAFDALSLPGCAAQRDRAIPAVAFSRDGAVLATTSCGVVRRGPADKAFSFVLGPRTGGSGEFTALSVSDKSGGTRRVWTRTRDAVYVSTNDGVTWSTFPIPTTINGVGVVTAGARGELQSLAAVDVPGGDPLAFLPYDPAGFTQNYVNTLQLDASTGAWTAQALTTIGRGTGLGGRIQMKSFVLDYSLAGAPGPQTILMLNAGQNIFRGTGAGSSTIDWAQLADSDWDGQHPDLHSDLWDFIVPPNYGVGAGLTDTFFIVDDGGVSKKSGSSFLSLTSGLHTHHAHAVTSLLDGHTHRPLLFYPTADNDGWARPITQISGQPAAWAPWTTQGDVNFSEGDRAYAKLGLLARNGSTAGVVSFGNNVSGAVTNNGNGYMIDPGAVGPGQLVFLQSVDDEAPYPLLDAVMLVPTPSQWIFPVPSNPNGGPILIRNRQFAAHPDIKAVASAGNTANGAQIWTTELTDLPPGTARVWASGGHAKPTYFAFAMESGAAGIYRRIATGWQRLSIGAPVPNNWGGTYGPVFVNPYDPTHVVVATTTGVFVSRSDATGNLVFTSDDELTWLLTNGTQYPLTTGFGGANEASEPQGMGSHANTMPYLTSVAFGPESPHHQIVATSPFTGAFYANDDARAWRSLSYVLPRPMTSVSDATIDYDGVSLATEGRSLLKVHEHKKARTATIYLMNPGQGRIAALWAHQLPLSNEKVLVTVRSGGNGAVLASALETTDPSGGIAYPSGVAQGTDTIVQLDFAGDATYAPSQTVFELSAPNPTPLTLSVTTSGSGAVNGGSIACPAACSGAYAIGATATLTATPAAGWQFGSWSGACAGTSPSCTVTMDQSKSVTATFTPQATGNYSLKVNLVADPTCAFPSGGVASTPAGINCQLTGTTTTCAANYAPGTSVSLIASPGSITNFIGYTGDCVTGSTTCSLSMNANKTVNATFCGLIQ